MRSSSKRQSRTMLPRRASCQWLTMCQRVGTSWKSSTFFRIHHNGMVIHSPWMQSLKFYAIIPILKTVERDSTWQRWKGERNSTYTTLNQSNKELLRGIIREMTPSNGPWFEINNILKLCYESFNESAASVAREGMPTNRIACIAHMLCNRGFLAFNIP